MKKSKEQNFRQSPFVHRRRSPRVKLSKMFALCRWTKIFVIMIIKSNLIIDVFICPRWTKHFICPRFSHLSPKNINYQEMRPQCRLEEKLVPCSKTELNKCSVRVTRSWIVNDDPWWLIFEPQVWAGLNKRHPIEANHVMLTGPGDNDNDDAEHHHHYHDHWSGGGLWSRSVSTCEGEDSL